MTVSPFATGITGVNVGPKFPEVFVIEFTVWLLTLTHPVPVVIIPHIKTNPSVGATNPEEMLIGAE